MTSLLVIFSFLISVLGFVIITGLLNLNLIYSTLASIVIGVSTFIFLISLILYLIIS
jgi:hypothetical protein